MTRLINADDIPWFVEGVGDIPVVTKDEIDRMPTVDAVPVIRCKAFDSSSSPWQTYFEKKTAIKQATPVRHGKWIPKEIMVHNYYAITGFKCSACGEDALDDDAEPMTDYCTHCGARMDAE
jgi:hypothetical protein